MFILPTEVQSELNTLESIKSTISYTWQEIIGPTTQHLLFELYLLLCLTILTASSLITLYNYSFGLHGDWHLLLITFLWLGRYLFLRIICTGNITSTSNLLNGINICGYEIKLNLRSIRLLVTRFITAGQYFDQPRAVSESDASRYWSSYGGFVMYISAFLFSWLFTLATRMVDLILHLKNKLSKSSTTSSHGRRRTGRNESKQSSSLMKEPSGNTPSGNFSSSDHSQPSVTGLGITTSTPSVQAYIQSSHATGAVQNLLEQYWQYAPPSHLVVACVVGFMCCYGASSLNALMERNTLSSLTFETLRTTTQNANVYARGIINGKNVQTTTTERNAAALNHWMGGFAGSVTHDLFAPSANSKAMSVGPFGYPPPSIFMYLIGVAAWGTLVSLVTFGRIIFPIPDIISGVTPTPTGRSDQRNSSGKTGKARKDFPWSERYRSVNKENRFRLHFQIIFLRMVENVFVCVYLPQTLFACRVTKHCTSAPAAWDRRWDLMDEERFGATCLLYDALPFDRTATFFIGLSVAMVTALILLTQVVILDKSSLASIGLKYAAKQEVAQSRISDNSKNKSGSSSGVSSKRKGKGKHNDSTAMSSASSSLSSSSADAYHRAGHDMFQFELGHHSTSTVIVQLTKIMFFHLGILMMCCFFRFLSDTNFVALCVALFPCVIAAYVVPSAGQADTFEVENLSDKIRYFYEEQEKSAKKRVGA